MDNLTIYRLTGGERGDDVVEVVPQWSTGAGLARALPARLHEPMLPAAGRHDGSMDEIAARALAAQAAVGDLFVSTLVYADRTLAALQQMRSAGDGLSAQAELDAFYGMQRSQYLGWLHEIATRGAALIVAELGQAAA